jgi:hypothetical protein
MSIKTAKIDQGLKMIRGAWIDDLQPNVSLEITNFINNSDLNYLILSGYSGLLFLYSAMCSLNLCQLTMYSRQSQT